MVSRVRLLPAPHGFAFYLDPPIEAIQSSICFAPVGASHNIRPCHCAQVVAIGLAALVLGRSDAQPPTQQYSFFRPPYYQVVNFVSGGLPDGTVAACTPVLDTDPDCLTGFTLLNDVAGACLSAQAQPSEVFLRCGFQYSSLNS